MKRRTTKKKTKIPEISMLFKRSGVSKRYAEKYFKQMAKPKRAKIVKLKNGNYNIQYEVYRFLPVDPNWTPQS